MKRLLVAVMLMIASSVYSASMGVVDISATLYNEQPAIAIIFDKAIDVKDNYDNFIEVMSANNATGQVSSKGIVDKGLQIVYYIGLENNAKYNVKVKKGLKGMNGELLAADYSKTITTNKLTPAAWFTSPGVVMLPSDRTVLPVTASNIDNVLVNFYRASVNSNKYWFSSNGNYEAYTGSMQYDLNNYEFVKSKSYNLNAINKQLNINIEVPKELFSKPGVYAAVMQYGGSYEKVPMTTFIISDIGIQVRKATDSKNFEIWTRSIETGAPIADVYIYTVHYSDKVVETATTNANGYATLAYNPKELYLIVAKKGDQYAIVNTGTPLDLSEFPVDGDRFTALQSYIYGPRDLYRGGETIKYNILVRNYDGNLVNPGSVNIKLYNSRGQQVDNKSVLLDSSYGYYQYSYDLENSAPTGQWRIELSVADLNDSYSFSVEDFMPETMRLTLGQPNEPLIVSKATATKISALGEYLYGAPAVGNTIEGRYNVRKAVNLSSKWKGYIFGDDTSSSIALNQYLDQKQLDKDGKASWDVSRNEAFKNSTDLSPIRVQYYVTLYESGGRAINRGKEYVYLPSGEAIGIRPQFKDYASTTGDNVFSIINVNDKEDAIGAKVAITLIKEDRNYYWDYNSDYGWRSGYTSVYYPISTREAELGTKPMEISYRFESGYYRLEVKNLNTGQKVNYDFSTGDWWQNDTGDGTITKPESLNLTFDKPSYTAGDTAKLTITSPYNGVGRVFVENHNGSLWQQNIKIDGNKTIINIPVANNWDTHDIYVSAYISRLESEMEKSQKSVVMGITPLNLNRENRKIALTLKHPESVEPNKDFEVIIKSNDPAKFGANTLVTLAVVDQGVLSLKAFETPDAWKYFFRKLGYSVRIWDNFWQVVHKYSNKMATRYGGDMMMAEMKAIAAAKGGALARADVKVVSIFTAPILLDHNGEARIKVNIPSFNGEVRLMALAFGKNSYGSTESTMKVAEPIISELSMPRFLATGDTTELTLDVQNMTGSAQRLTVTAKVAAPLQLYNTDVYKKDIQLESGKKTILKIPVRGVGTSGFGNIDISIDGYKSPIKKTWRLAVRPPYPAITKTKYDTLTPGKNITLFKDNLTGYVIDSATVSVDIQTLPPLGIETNLKYLLEYPYGCLEQTVSSTFPLLYANQEVRKKFNIKLPESIPNDAARREAVEYGIRRILAKQLSSGGFGYWDSNSPESPWGTVYAVELLNEAKRMGYTVDQNALNNANNRVNTYIRKDITSPWTEYYDNSNQFRISLKAYAAYVLSMEGKATLADVRYIYNGLAILSETPLPVYQLAVALKNAGDPAKAAEAYEKAQKMRWPEFRYYGDYSSTIRDRSWIVVIANQYAKQGNNKIAEMIFILSSELSKRSWLSTQESLRLFQAALQMDISGELKGVLSSPSNKEEVNTTGSFIKTYMAKRVADGLYFESKNKETNLYAKTEFVAYPIKSPSMLKDNATIERTYYDIEGRLLNISSVKVGDYVVVELAYGASLNTADGLIVDLVPAGFEIENQNLDNTKKLSSVKLPNRGQNGNIVYTEYRDDRLIMAVNMMVNTPYYSYYIMRAVTPGKYTNPTPYFEDMYRANVRSLGITAPESITISPR